MEQSSFVDPSLCISYVYALLNLIMLYVTWIPFSLHDLISLWSSLQKLKYGVVRMNDLVQDILDWNRFYLSGRLQKPVCHLLGLLTVQGLWDVCNRQVLPLGCRFICLLIIWTYKKTWTLLIREPQYLQPFFSCLQNSPRLKSFCSALKSSFMRLYTNTTLMQEDLYAKICSLSYMGDLRMLFAEDTNKVRENLVLFLSTSHCEIVLITC